MSSSSLHSRASHLRYQILTWALVLNLTTNFGIKLYLQSVTLSQCWKWYQLSMNHSLTSFFKNPLMTSKRSVSFHPLASTFTTKFFKKKVGFSPTLPEKDLGVTIGWPRLDCSLTIHSATCHSLSAAGFWTFSGTSIFHQSFGLQTSLLFSSSFPLLPLLSSPSPEPFRKLVFPYFCLCWSFVFFLFSLFLLFGIFEKVQLDDDKFWIL